MTIFGVAWNDLSLENVRQFLTDSGPEPLLWEAKGIQADKREIRRQVCGFANSHEGGYLIIGADETAGSWTVDGVQFADEPPIWIANIVGDGGVTPYPDGLDTRAWPTPNGRQVAVVWVPPIPTPPCNTFGRVFERVSGKTIAVREPLRLAALFERGDQARAAAEKKADRAARDAIDRGRDHPSYEDTHVQFGLGLAAAGYLPDISSRLFTQPFEQGVISSIQTVLNHDALGPGPAILPDVTQDSRIFQTQTSDSRLGSSWSVRITWDGAVSIYWVQGVTQTRIATIVEGPMRNAWAAADEMLGLLAPQGPRYLQVMVAGAMFPANPADLPQWGAERPKLPVVSRGPLGTSVQTIILEGITRELLRSTGDMAYET